MPEPEKKDAVRTVPSQKRIRTYFAGELVADSTDPLLVWNLPARLNYFLPEKDVVPGVLRPTEHSEESKSEGVAHFFDVVVGENVAKNAACQYASARTEEVRERILFHWEAMDSWFEEDDQVFFHPADPFHRVDVRSSSRHVVVELDGVTIADSEHARICFETNLPARYYLPLVDVRMDLLRPTETQTRCPYKGTASYWSIDVNGVVRDDLVWCYKTPFFESLSLAGHAAFYNEKLDIYVDGALDPRSAARARS